MEIKKYQDIILPAINEAGEMLLEKFKNFDRKEIRLKAKHEIITEYDLLSEKIILNKIKKNFPEHSIVSEEEGESIQNTPWQWVIDPIDGTTNFSIHNPFWSISVALFYKENPVLGIVYAPVLQELYCARQGEGAFLNQKKIKVSEINSGKILNAFCHSRKEEDIKTAIKYFAYQKIHGFDCRQMGSAAIELAFVASGRIESLTIPGANAWDVGAGVLLVQEAGGKVTDFENKNWTLKSKDMVATNQILHEQILKAIAKSKDYGF